MKKIIILINYKMSNPKILNTNLSVPPKEQNVEKTATYPRSSQGNTIGAIMPDTALPHLPDGSYLEIIYNRKQIKYRR